MKSIALAVILLIMLSGVLWAQSIIWPANTPTAARSALDQSKMIVLVVIDPTATTPGKGTPIRAPLTGW